MKSLLLYSGGADSTLLLYRDKPTACLFIRYGQVHMKEYWYARSHCEVTGIPLVELDAPKLLGSSLTGGVGSCVVPARNLVFLSLAANYAEANGYGEILLGCNKDDEKGFPDCRGGFWIAASEAMKAAGLAVVPRLPLIDLTKQDIFQQLRGLSVSVGSTWSCYAGTEKPCGVCDACLLRAPLVGEFEI